MKKILISALLLSASVFNVNTHAEEAGGFYVGVGLGKVDIDDTAGLSIDSGITPKFYAGYKFNPKIAIEGHYISSEIDVTGLGGSGTIDFNSTGVSLISTLPLSPKFSLLGKIGFASNEATASAGGSSVSADDSGLIYGLGAQYNLNNNFGIRGEFEVLESDANLFTIGANYTF